MPASTYPSLSGGGASFSQGTLASRPATPNPNQLYYATDTGEWWVGNAAGNAWQSIAKTSATMFRAGASGMGIGDVSGNQGLDFGGNGNMQWVGTGIKGFNKGLFAVGGLGAVEAANSKQGTGTLVAGSAVVANTSVTANSRIFVTSNADGGTPGFLRVSARTAGTSFTVTSSSGTDTSTFAYEIFEPG